MHGELFATTTTIVSISSVTIPQATWLLILSVSVVIGGSMLSSLGPERKGAETKENSFLGIALLSFGAMTRGASYALKTKMLVKSNGAQAYTPEVQVVA